MFDFSSMFNFSSDEVICLFAAIWISVLGLFRWYGPLLSMPSLGRSDAGRVMLGLFPPLMLLITLVVVVLWADPQVAGHLDYILLFLFLQGASVTLGCETLRLLGIGLGDDAVERNNFAAAVAVVGFISALAIVFALSNVGGGPTIWTTILPALASSLILVALWLMVELLGGGVAEAIAIDRDAATATRVAGAMIGCSLVLGRAAAGNWISWHQTWRDTVVLGWPAIAIAATAALLQRLYQPTVVQPRPRLLKRGIVPAVVFVAGGVLILALTPHSFDPAKW